MISHKKSTTLYKRPPPCRPKPATICRWRCHLLADMLENAPWLTKMYTQGVQWLHMSAMASQIIVRLTICSTACHDSEQKKYLNILIATKSFVLPKSRLTAFSLQWLYMSAMASQITARLTICSTGCHDWEQKIHPHILIGNKIICNTEIAFWNTVITVTPYERHAVSNHRQIDFLFNIIF